MASAEFFLRPLHERDGSALGALLSESPDTGRIRTAVRYRKGCWRSGRRQIKISSEWWLRLLAMRA
ncbi:MAG: hypothetical protein J7M05_07140 [Anaerolineae bacterium]|nr:hypothetical protein [Anaerolineae bacterium]